MTFIRLLHARNRGTHFCWFTSFMLYSMTVTAQQPLSDIPEFSGETHRLFTVFPATPPEQCGSLCGKTLAMDGNTLVLGASYQIKKSLLPGPLGSRYPIVLEKRGNSWVKAADLQAYNPDVFTTESWPSTATSVAAEGDLVALGDPNDTNTNQGAVRIYAKPDGGWPGPGETKRVQAKAVLWPPLKSDELGTSVAILNGAVIGGAPAAELFGLGFIPEHGAVYIWEEPPGGWGSLEPDAQGRPVKRRPDHVIAPSDFGGGKMGMRIAVSEFDGAEEIVVTNENANEFFLLRRNGLTWKFDPILVEGVGGGSLTVNELIYDGSTLAVGYEEENFFHVMERPAAGLSQLWKVSKLSRAACSRPDECDDDEFGLGRSLAFIPGGILAGDPFMYSDAEVLDGGLVLRGGLFRFMKPATGWENVTLPWADHFKPVFPAGLTIPSPYTLWADSIAYSDGALVVNFPYAPPDNPFEPRAERTITGISLYNDGSLFSDGFEAPVVPEAVQIAEPAKKLYFFKDEFCADTQATHATGNDVGVCSQGDASRLPDIPVETVNDLTLGRLRFTSEASHTLAVDQLTLSLPGPDIAVSDSEEFDVATVPAGSDIYSIGFTVYEDFEGNTNEPGLKDDSLFTLSLYNGNTLVYRFDFNPMNKREDFLADTAVFIGVWSDEPFDRATLRETRYFDTRGSSENNPGPISEETENEFFGPFFTGTLPRLP